MSINNLSIVNWSDSIGVHKVNGLYVLDNPVWIDFLYNDNKFRISVDAGAMTDGLSVPKIFRWYLPDWDNDNVLYNIAGIVHDGLYGSEKVSKDLADEIFYQGLLKAGISKSKATIAKWAVEHLAGLHYGREHDDFDIAPHVQIRII
jgi:hypothetical protein